MNKTGLLLFLLLSPCFAWGQLSVGIRGGYASSSYTYQAAPGIRTRSVEGIIAPTFSLVIEYFNSKNTGIELNAQQLTIGFRQFGPKEELNQTEFTYLKFPLLASVFAGRSGRFQIKAGPHLGWLNSVNDVSRTYSGATPKEIPTYAQPGDQPNKLMYGLTFGAGISKLFGKSTLSGEARFSYDFTNPEGQNRIFDMKSTNLEFTLAYLFRIKEKKEQP
jgi:hypothetical protein